MVGVAGVFSAGATLTQKYKLPKLNTWILNLYTGLLGFTVTGTIALVIEDITFPSQLDKMMYVIAQVMDYECVYACMQSALLLKTDGNAELLL